MRNCGKETRSSPDWIVQRHPPVCELFERVSSCVVTIWNERYVKSSQKEDTVLFLTSARTNAANWEARNGWTERGLVRKSRSTLCIGENCR